MTSELYLSRAPSICWGHRTWNVRFCVVYSPLSNYDDEMISSQDVSSSRTLLPSKDILKSWSTDHPALCSSPLLHRKRSAHKEWMGADRQELTRPLWRLTSVVASYLMLWGTPLESPSWIGLHVISNKTLPVGQWHNWIIRGTYQLESSLLSQKAYYHIQDGSVGTPRPG